jgi:ethanolamine utilization protein EutN
VVKLARVVGTVVARRVYAGLADKKLLVLEPLDHQQRVVGERFVAVDTVMAGPGELVFFVGSREAALGLEPWFVPVDATIVGIVDSLPDTLPDSLPETAPA